MSEGHDEQSYDFVPRELSEVETIRHSTSHLLASAVSQLYPGTKFGFGPHVEHGFYYDMELPTPISTDDLPAIEERMREIAKGNHRFEHKLMSKEEAITWAEQTDQPYKRENISTLDAAVISFYTHAGFTDMCAGPHVNYTKKLKHFKLTSVAGAYWRGDVKRPMLTRIYGVAFGTREELDAHLTMLEEAKRRDHKKLGKELDLFVIDDVIGKGLPLWMPNGTVIRDELEKLMRELEFKDGYHRVATPHLARESLYYQTGHLPYYAPHMYPAMEVRETAEGEPDKVKEVYRLRPMNCPHHHRIFAARLRSYRDLPLRLAEYGHVYRFEDSGALSGLLRVRGMCMNDAHIYCTEDQIEDEFVAVMELHRKVYAILGLTDYYMRFSTWDPDDPKGKDKYVDNPEAWARSQDLVRRAMDRTGLPYTEVKGEAAFYGPKIDVQFRTVTGREETASTNQLDFAVPTRMGLTYRGADNGEHAPYVIHRAPLGTHERFVAFLIEHFAGAFPTWLAPVQVRVITVSERFEEAGKRVVAGLREGMVRAELDASSETMGKKVRESQIQKIPNVLVIGEREAAEGTVTLRRYGSQDQRSMSAEAFRALVGRAIAERSDAVFSPET